jgi:hypothetical protein
MKLIEAAGFLWESQERYFTHELAKILSEIFFLSASGHNTLLWESGDELLNPQIYDFLNDNGFMVDYYGDNQIHIEW